MPTNAATRSGYASSQASSTAPPRSLDQLKADATRHGFDFWVLMAGAQQVAVSGLALLSSGEPDPAQLADPHRDA